MEQTQIWRNLLPKAFRHVGLGFILFITFLIFVPSQALANETYGYVGEPFDLAYCENSNLEYGFNNICMSGNVTASVTFDFPPGFNGNSQGDIDLVSASASGGGVSLDSSDMNGTTKCFGSALDLFEFAEGRIIIGKISFHGPSSVTKVCDGDNIGIAVGDTAETDPHKPPVSYGHSDAPGVWTLKSSSAQPPAASTYSPKNLGCSNCGASTALPDGDSGIGSLLPAATLVGNPINAATGNKFQIQVDYRGSGNTGLSFVRYYNSYDFSPSSPLGIGWHSTYHHGLTVSGAVVTVTRADGRQDTFTKGSSGAYTADPDVTSTLAPIPQTGTRTGWKITLNDDSVENYNLSGELISIVTRAGLVTTLAYNTKGQLATVTGPFGHTLTFTYNSAGHLSALTLPDKIYSFNYTYDSSGNLVSASNPNFSERKYQYGLTPFANLLTAIIDEDGNIFASWTYDSTGRALTSEHANGADLTKVAYGTNGTNTATDARGNAHTYATTKLFNMEKPTEITGVPYPAAGGSAFSYDTNGFLSKLTDFNENVTTYIHNSKGEEISRTEAYGTNLSRTITTTWSTTFHLPTEIVEPNRTTTFTYDAHGNMLTKTMSDATNTREWAYTYNENGQVLTVKNPNGNVTTYTYDAKGDVTAVKNALGQTWQYTSYDGDGRLLSATDPNGVVTQLTYDGLGDLLVKRMGTIETQYAYDPAGMLNKITQPDFSAISYAYDGAHRLIKINDTASDTVAFTYDATSNETAVDVRDPSNNLVSSHTFTYDTANRVETDSGALAGETTTYSYDRQGNLLSLKNPLSHFMSYTYDDLNRLSTETDPYDGKTSYGYNANDYVVSVEDPRGLKTTYAYDGLGDLLSTVSPDTGTTTRTYDKAGNLLTSTDARKDVTTYIYDALSRATKIAFTGGTSEVYTYDTGSYGVGRLAKVVDPVATTAFTYNEFGQLLTKTQVIGSISLPLTYIYDFYNRLSTITYPSGKTLTYSYDTSGRIDGISAAVGSIAYFPFGPAKSWTEANGQTFSRTFDADGRIKDIALGATVNVQALTYDGANHIDLLTETGLASKSFAYDSFDRLTNFLNGAATTAYAYDADGNRSSVKTSAGTTIYNYPTTNNRLATLTGSKAETDNYDVSGHMLVEGTVDYSYDARGFVSTSVNGGVTTTYGVNALGQRVKKVGKEVPNGETNYYLYDDQGRLVGEYNSSGVIVNETVWLPDTPISVLKNGYGTSASPVAVQTGTGGAVVYSVTPDWLNAPHIIQNSSKQDVWTWDHHAFGDNGPNQSPSKLAAFVYNLRFPGQYADAETGTSYNTFRTYDSAIGRYLQSDPIGLGAGVNTYGYVQGDPLTRIDPNGEFAVPLGILCIVDPWACAAGAVATLAGMGGGYAISQWWNSANSTTIPSTDGGDPPGAQNLTPFNPGCEGNGNCKPCPANQTWSHPGDAHGSSGGVHYHGIVWNQDPKTCVCHPKRVSGPNPNDME